jgi:4-hydroxy-tetrahydrodipicolinate reductase
VLIAVVGYGKMGREVDSVLRERGHEPVPVLRGQAFPADCVVGIDFTAPDGIEANITAALAAGARYVVGTTGWSDRRDAVAQVVTAKKGGLVHAANFSLGVNIFYLIVRQAGALLAPFPEYDPYILERHHREKKDAPSGTAKVLAGFLEAAGARDVPVTSLRAGGIVGDHTVGFDSGGDEILLEHRARSRRGFAIGAVLAAEWIATRSGVHAFEAVLDDLLQARRRA